MAYNVSDNAYSSSFDYRTEGLGQSYGTAEGYSASNAVIGGFFTYYGLQFVLAVLCGLLSYFVTFVVSKCVRRYMPIKIRNG